MWCYVNWTWDSIATYTLVYVIYFVLVLVMVSSSIIVMLIMGLINFAALEIVIFLYIICLITVLFQLENSLSKLKSR
jgi:fumarate reductase subunit C